MAGAEADGNFGGEPVVNEMAGGRSEAALGSQCGSRTTRRLSVSKEKLYTMGT